MSVTEFCSVLSTASDDIRMLRNLFYVSGNRKKNLVSGWRFAETLLLCFCVNKENRFWNVKGVNFYPHFLMSDSGACYYLQATDWPALLYSYSYISTCCFSMFLSYSCPFCTSMWTEVLLKKKKCGCSLGYFWDVLQRIWWNGKHPCQSWNVMHPHPVCSQG